MRSERELIRWKKEALPRRSEANGEEFRRAKLTVKMEIRPHKRRAG